MFEHFHYGDEKNSNLTQVHHHAPRLLHCYNEIFLFVYLELGKVSAMTVFTERVS